VAIAGAGFLVTDRWRTSIGGLGGALLETVYPRRCAGCGRRGTWLCPACDADLARFAEPWCPRCGIPFNVGRCCCRDLADALDLLRSLAPFDGWLRRAIHAFKYEDETARVDHLGEALASVLPASPPVDGLVPVPLHSSRLRRRGYNQARLLADRVGRVAGLPTIMALERTRATHSQVGLGAAERAANVAGAFLPARGVDPRGTRLLLVDDVVTTGSTLSACAAALKTAGASFVGALTLAREI